MSAKRIFAIVTICFLILSGCVPAGDGTPELDAIGTLAAQITPVENGEPQSGGVLILPTETPSVAQGQGDAPQPTKANASIVITTITETGAGKAIVSWDAIGEFPSGYKLVWTTEERNPTFPEDSNTYIGDPYARSALFSGSFGKIYFLRVCRFANDGCDVYSNLGIFAFSNTAPTEAQPGTAKTVYPTTSGGGTVSASLQILSMSGGETGKAYMQWKSDVNPSKGFKILYSKTNTKPTLGVDQYFYISDNATRTAYVDGVQGTKYYYRICRYNGTTCDAYSETYTYTFPGVVPPPTPDPAVINITSILDTTTSQAQVTWTATGTFPSGFKILYSKTNPLPTLSDTYVYVSDGALRTGVVTGDPSATYYFRVCKYYGGTCVAYSPAVTFTFAAEPVSTITNVALTDELDSGFAQITWDAAGWFPLGFKILFSTTESTPTFENAEKILVGDGSAREAIVKGTPGTLYYYRLCKWTGSSCGVYSDVVEFTYAPLRTQRVSK